jgi:hypothetical protein
MEPQLGSSMSFGRSAELVGVVQSCKQRRCPCCLTFDHLFWPPGECFVQKRHLAEIAGNWRRGVAVASCNFRWKELHQECGHFHKSWYPLTLSQEAVHHLISEDMRLSQCEGGKQNPLAGGDTEHQGWNKMFLTQMFLDTETYTKWSRMMMDSLFYHC